MKLETFALLLVLVAALYTGWYVYQNYGEQLLPAKQQAQTPQPQPAPQAQAQAQPRLPMPPRYPVALPDKLPEGNGSQATEPPFPDRLDGADDYLQARLGQLVTDKKLLELLQLKNFIQKLVVIIDALPEPSLPLQHLPIQPPRSVFRTQGTADAMTIDPRNQSRYTPYVRLAEAIPDDALLRLYQGLYPLFQTAYRQMGKPSGHFSDRLIMVIDHLLETPEIEGPPAVVRHVNRFKFVDPQLESRSAGQKVLLRMGTENGRRIKQKLQNFRHGLIGNRGQ